MSVRKKAYPYVAAWLFIALTIAIVPFPFSAFERELDFLKSALPGAGFYYASSGHHSSVIVLMGYMIVSTPILAYFLSRIIIREGNAFIKEDVWAAVWFLFLCPLGISMPGYLWGETSVKLGEMFRHLIELGSIGVLVYLALWCGSLVYGMTVIAVVLLDKFSQVE
jgi:hypothetical protein